METIVFPDAAAIVIGYLDDELTAAVLPRIPDPRLAEFLTVQRVGGPRRSLVSDAPLLAIGAWGDDDETAHDLAQNARGLIHALLGTVQAGVPVYLIEEAAGPALLPDPLSNQSRYVFTVAVHLRGVAATPS